MQFAKYVKTVWFALVCAAVAGAGSYAATSPYAGQEDRSIKALSSSDVADLLGGKGMGFAKAAELNGYPGPSHVLELSSKLELTPEQIAGTQAIFQRMDTQARALGVQIVEAERGLDRLFRSRTVTPESLKARLQQISLLQAKVRETHLKAHIEQTALLSQEQVSRYSQLRGYAGNGSAGHHGHHH
jgi:hypothetical protein